MIPGRQFFQRVRPRVPWTPGNIPLSLRPLYLSAADAGGLLVQSGGVVTSWTGRQGGLAFTAAGSPAYSATGLAGAYPLVSGDGVSANLTAAATTGLPTGTATCVIAGLVNAGGSVSARIVDYGGTSASTARRITAGADLAAVASGALAAVGAIDSTMRPRVMVGIMTATEAILRVDGREISRVIGTLPSTGTTRARLFSNTAGTAGNFSAHGITELLIGTTWTDRQIEQFEGYCAHSYPLAGITLPDAHPYRSSAP